MEIIFRGFEKVFLLLFDEMFVLAGRVTPNSTQPKLGMGFSIFELLYCALYHWNRLDKTIPTV
jgi:hypothetical protein